MGIRRLARKLSHSIHKRLPGKGSSAGNRAIRSEVPFLVPSNPLERLFQNGDQVDVTMLPRLIRSHKWAMPEHELLTLGALAALLKPKLVVEFGTFMGGSTLAMAANIASDSRIVTIDLEPTARKTHVHGMGVGLSEFEVGCLFKGTPYESKIQQRFANSVEFTDQDLIGQADLVFVDADHTYEFAKRDTQTALQLLKPNGTILWHDYTWEPENPECVGVTRAVNEFWETHGSCSQIEGTRFALHMPGIACNSKLKSAA